MKRNIKICIVGLGYVGLPLAIEFGKKYSTIGYDIDSKRIKSLTLGNDINKDIFLKKNSKNKKLIFTDNINTIKDCNYYIVCVPTPVNIKNKPDMSGVIKASKTICSLSSPQE